MIARRAPVTSRAGGRRGLARGSRAGGRARRRARRSRAGALSLALGGRAARGSHARGLRQPAGVCRSGRRPERAGRPRSGCGWEERSRGSRARRGARDGRALLVGGPRAEPGGHGRDRRSLARVGEGAAEPRGRAGGGVASSRRRSRRPRRSDPRWHRLRFEVRAETMALFRDAQAAIRAQLGGEVDDDTLLYEIARRALGGPGDEGRASYQVAVTRCEDCGRTSIDAGGGATRSTTWSPRWPLATAAHRPRRRTSPAPPTTRGRRGDPTT
jgi:hypothetical protein